MNRDEFVDLLARLVADGALSEEGAADLIRRFDAGELDDWDMPLPLQEAIRRPDDALAALALAVLLGVLPRRQLRRFSPIVGRELANNVQDVFVAQARLLARKLSSGQIRLADWQQDMARAVEINVRQQMLLATGRERLTARQTERLAGTVQEQTGYLSRFADEIALRAGTDKPLSEAYIANRAQQYGGVGRGEFFESTEEAMQDAGELGTGYVVDYISQDDPATCWRCLNHDRGSPYLPGTRHPWPARDCLGKDFCRCYLEYRYDPETYRRLGGR